MLKHAIEKLLERQPLTQEEARQSLEGMLNGANPFQIAAFLALLRSKGETADELIGMASALEAQMVAVSVTLPVLDIVGTGGDNYGTVNISTGASLIAAACGVKIAKHGNRSISSQCGAADVLEALGIAIDRDAATIAEAIETIGIGFMFAPAFHPGLKSLAEVRRGLNMRTIFNLLGPLLNPARAEYRMIGVARSEQLPLIAKALQGIGTTHSLVFHGNGLDELSCAGPAEICEISPEGIRSWILDPQQYHLPSCSIDELRGGKATENAAILMRAWSGEEGAVFNTLALNAGVAVWLYEIAPTIEAGIEMAIQQLKEGQVIHKYNQWKNYDQLSRRDHQKERERNRFNQAA
ncbi:MAG: anthranilate phosphoribosyltransferase [Parachlamydia sp.]|nr:anthranilate phosphoribosyltransferase [Parachlamydia sp.]